MSGDGKTFSSSLLQSIGFFSCFVGLSNSLSYFKHFVFLSSLTRRVAIGIISSSYTLFRSFKRGNTLNSLHLKKSFSTMGSSKSVFWTLPCSRTTLRARGSLRLCNCAQAVCGAPLRTTDGTSSTYCLQDQSRRFSHAGKPQETGEKNIIEVS